MISKAGIRKRRERERQKDRGLALVQEWVPEKKIPLLREAAKRLRNPEQPESPSPWGLTLARKIAYDHDLSLDAGDEVLLGLALMKLLEAERRACARLCRDPETRAAILTRTFDPESDI